MTDADLAEVQGHYLKSEQNNQGGVRNDVGLQNFPIGASELSNGIAQRPPEGDIQNALNYWISPTGNLPEEELKEDSNLL